MDPLYDYYLTPPPPPPVTAPSSLLPPSLILFFQLLIGCVPAPGPVFGRPAAVREWLACGKSNLKLCVENVVLIIVNVIE